MNKELIKKYKVEFDYWLNGGKILMHYGKWVPVTLDAKWEFSISDLEKMGSFGYIIDNEYVEFRKAGAEGKQLQVSYDNGKIWYDKSYKKISWSKSQLVRIKPEETKFKVGDWVRDLRNNRIFHINSENFNLNLSITNGVYELWQPKLGEWCWFWNSNGSPVLEQFSKYHKLNKRLGIYETFTVKLYLHCEPFIGELPTNLKDSNES